MYLSKLKICNMTNPPRKANASIVTFLKGKYIKNEKKNVYNIC